MLVSRVDKEHSEKHGKGSAEYVERRVSDDLPNLFVRLAEEDTDAMVRIYERTAPLLFAQIHRILQSDALSQEALRSVFASLWAARKDWAAEGQREEPWVMLRNLTHRIALEVLYALPHSDRPASDTDPLRIDTDQAYLDCPQIEPNAELKNTLIDMIRADLNKRGSKT